MTSNPDIDRMVIDAVQRVRDRFGADGLRGLIALATTELQQFERSRQPLDLSDPQATDLGDTQAWLAFTEDSRTDG